MAEGQYKFSISLDDKQLKMDVAQAKKAFDELVKAAREAGVKIDESFDNPFDKLVPPTNLPRQTEAAAQSFNGLNMATQQLVRELPSATMGLNTFFLAVSNNLPIFADQIKAATEANKELVAQGKPTTSVFKQIIGSLFSWQSALIVGVTALSMYGKEIGNWVANLFKGKKAVDDMAEAERQLRETRVQGRINAQEEATNLMLTVKAMQDSTRTIEERRLAMQRLQGEYPSYFSNISEEILLYGDLSGTINELVTNMYNMQRARTALDRLIENKETIEMLKGTAGYNEYQNAQNLFRGGGQKKHYILTNEIGSFEQTKHYVDEGGLGTYTTPEYEKLLKAQKSYLNNLEAQGGKAAELAETIRKQFNGDIDAFQKSLEAANTALEADVKPLVDEANAAERKRQAEEAKRRQEEADRQRRIAANAAKSKQDKLSEMQEQLAKDAAKARTDATIAAMEEGLEREKAQINAEYDAKAQLISEREAELKKLQKGELTDEQQADFQALRDANENQRAEAIAQAENKATEAMQKTIDEQQALRERELDQMNEYLIQYGTFLERQSATKEKYARAIAKAQTEGEKMALEQERDAILAGFEVVINGWADSIANASAEVLQQMIDDAETALKVAEQARDMLPDSSTDDAKNLLKQINTLRAQIALMKQQLSGTKSEGDMLSSLKSQLPDIHNAAQLAAQTIAMLADNFRQLSESIDDEKLKEASAQLSSVSQNFSAAASGAASGGWIGAIIGGATDMLAQTVEAITNTAVEADEAMNNALNFAREYQQILLTISESDYDSVFGTYASAKAQDAFSKATEALAAYNNAVTEELNETADKNARSWGALVFGGLWLGKKTTDLQKELAAAQEKGYNALQGMMVKTKDLSGWANFWGAEDEYTALADLVPELWSEDGLFNVDAARAFLESNTQITAEQRKQIENAIELQERYDDAVAAIDRELQSIFGSLSADITDAIFDSVRNGTNAWDTFYEKASGVIDKLGKQMLQEVFVQAYFDQYLERLRDAYGKENPQEELALITSEMFANMGEMVEAATKAAAEWDENARDMGFNPESVDSTTKTKGVAQASQDSVNELNGRMTAIQGMTGSLVEGQRQLINNSSQALTYLAGIESNTAELRQMRQDIGAMRKDISDISTRGVVTR